VYVPARNRVRSAVISVEISQNTSKTVPKISHSSHPSSGSLPFGIIEMIESITAKTSDRTSSQTRTQRAQECTRRADDRLFQMATCIALDFHGTRFTVPKSSLFNLFEHQRNLFDATTYEVQSSVPLGIFELFVKALETCTKVPLTKENAGAISLLAKEFWLGDLLSECSALEIASTPERIAALSERISKLEDQMSSQLLAIAELKGSIVDDERHLKRLDCRIPGLEPNLKTELKELKPGSPAPQATPTPVPPISPSKSLKEVEFPLNEAESFDGIIFYLTRKHGGNVHDKGIVTITTKSVGTSARPIVRNLADFTPYSNFFSNREPGQWVCWDFHEMRVRPTHYTIASWYLQSWVVESSLDGDTWTEIDRKTDSDDFQRA
jgi:uncharacterized coiled-coil protein SlyX